MKEITEQMLALAAKGNQYAIEDLYRLTYNSVYKTAKALLQDEDTVLDIVQDSYVKAFQSLEQLDSPENFRAWIKRIAANKAKDYLKKKKPILFSEMANEDGEEIDFQDENVNHLPEAVLDRKETTRLMDEILSSLSEDQRMAIALHYYQDMSIREIAELMDCSENTVKSRLNYGRKKVEAKVRELEKRGTKLYSLAPLPFLLWLFRMDAQAAEVPSAALLKGITAACSSGSAAAGAAGAAGAGAKAGAAAGVKTALAAKVAAGVLAAAVTCGAVVAAIPDREEPEEYYTHDELIAAYQEACRDDCSLWRANRKDYKILPPVIVEDFHHSDAMSIVYCDRDLDGNGTEELLVGLYDYDQNLYQLECIYTFDNGYAVPALKAEAIPGEGEFGDSALEELALTGENRVFKHYGNGKGQFVYSLWQLSEDGVTMEQTGEFFADFLEEQVRFDGQTISLQEFRTDYFEDITAALPWKILVPHPSLQGHPDRQEPEQTQPSDPRELYAPILEQYRNVVTMDSAAFLAAPETCFNGDHMAVRYYHMYHDHRFYFAYRDIDRNGVDELLIGINQDYRIAIVDLYGNDGTQVFQLLDEPTLADRSSVILQEDGVFAFTGSDGMGGTFFQWKILSGNTLTDTQPTEEPAMSGLPWELLLEEEEPAAQDTQPEAPGFDGILGDIRTTLTVSAQDYDSNMKYYDELYRHLGEGVMWMLLHRQSGDDTMCIWNTCLDIDGDGQEELCIGRGVSPANAQPIVIYKQSGEAIYGDAVYAYLDRFCGGAPVEWEYLGG